MLLTQHFTASATAYINKFVYGGPASDSDSIGLDAPSGGGLDGSLAVNQALSVPEKSIELEADLHLRASGSGTQDDDSAEGEFDLSASSKALSPNGQYGSQTDFNFSWSLDKMATGRYAYEVSYQYTTEGDWNVRDDHSTTLNVGFDRVDLYKTGKSGTLRGQWNGTPDSISLYMPHISFNGRSDGLPNTQTFDYQISYKIQKLQSDLAVADPATGLSYDPARNRLIGLYEVTGAPLSSPAEYSLDWVDKDGKTISAAYTGETETETGGHDFAVDPSALGLAPAGAVKLRLNLDPRDLVFELDEANNRAELDVPDLAATSLAFNAQGGVDFGYSVSNATLPAGTSVALYWASGNTPATILGGPIYGVAAGQGIGPYGPFRVAASSLGIRPQGATHLLLVADPSDSARPRGMIFESNELNNVLGVERSQSATDIAAKSLTWDFSRGGADLTYEIKGSDLPGPTDIGLFWSNGNSLLGGQTFSSAAPAQSTQVKVGTYTVHIPAADFAVPPKGTTHLVVSIDRSKTIDETDESPLSNEAANVLVISAPTVKLAADTTAPKKGQPYGLTATIINNGPVPLVFTLDTLAVDLAPDGLTTEPGQGGRSSGKVSFLESRDVPLGTFTSTWHWIPKKNPLSGLAILEKFPLSSIKQAIKSSGGQLIKQLLSINSYLDALKPVLAAEFDGRVSYAVHVKDSVGSFVDVQADRTVDLSIPDNLLKHFTAYVSSAGLGSSYMGSAIGSILAAIVDPTKVSLGAAIGFTAAASAAFEIARDQYDQAVDPPAPDFQVLATANPFSTPEVEALPAGPFRDLAVTSLRLQAVLAAASHSRDRAAGAELAGDPAWQSRQLIAAAGFTAEAADLEARLAAIDSQLLPFMTDTLSRFGGQVAPYLRMNGLPQAAVSILTHAGWTAAEVEGLRQYLISAAPAMVDDPEFITVAEKASSLVSTSISVGDLEKGIAIRVVQLGHSARNLEPSERLALDVGRSAIESGLAGKMPTEALRSGIASFLEKVGSLSEATDNPQALQADLDFGYGALAQYLQLVVAPPSVQAVKVNDGGAQRSMVTRLAVTMDGAVTLGEGSFELRNRDGVPIGLNVTSSLVDGKTVAVLTFRGPGLSGGSLADGRYTLTVHGDRIRDSQGRALDGNLDGNLGGDFVDTAISRLFGDTNGDGIVNNVDAFAFKAAMNKRAGQAGYLEFLDADGNGVVGDYDFAEMKKRYGKKLIP